MTTASKLGYLGPEGTHSHQAALAFRSLLPNAETVILEPFPSLHRLMQAVEEEASLAALLPVENVLEGSVIEVMETLGQQRRRIAPHCEFLFPVAHCLIARDDGADKIDAVLSHPQALSQCRENLIARYGSDLRFESVSSTAEAVRRLAEMDAKAAGKIAAIGTASAARIYDLPVIAENVSDTPDNMTRFFFVSSQPAKVVPTNWARLPHKTSVCFGVVDRPGALLDVLDIFRSDNVNLTRIESRPSRKRFGEYLFYVDAAGDITRDDFGELIASLQSHTTYLQIVGPYASLGVLHGDAEKQAG